MFRRILCLLAVLMLSCTAFAEPRYPERNGVATDHAGVLSARMLEDLRTLDDRLDHADALRIRIVTVDFLDGQDIDVYARTLFDRWHLDDEDILLLIAVGEESFTLFLGEEAAALLQPGTAEAILRSTFTEPYLDQQYDAALAAFIPGLVNEIGLVCGERIRTDDLFRSTSASLISNWASLLPTADDPADKESFLTREDKVSGFSLLKVILIVVLLLLVFGSFRKTRRMAHPYAPSPDKPRYFGPKKDPSDAPKYFHHKQ